MTKPNKPKFQEPYPIKYYPVYEGLTIDQLLHIYKKTAPVQLPIQFPK